MTYDLILVGGTGQRVGVVLGWLNVLGLAVPPRRVLVVDAEGNSAYPSRVSDRLQALLSFAWDGPSYFKRLPPFLQHAPTPFAELGSPSGDLWKLAFTQEEATLDIEKGFMGNPKVAATVFTSRLLREERKAVREFLPADHQLAPVLIVGSVAGGTGAGLLYALAQACREIIPAGHATAPILGLVYTNYLEVEDQQTRIQLDGNSRCGTDYLWHRWAEQDRFPFDSLVLCGPPLGRAGVSVRKEEVDVHAFPGFLLGASMVSDGCRRLVADVQARRAHPEDPTRSSRPYPDLYLIGARRDDDGAYLRGGDMDLHCERAAASLTADDLTALLDEVRHALSDMASFPWEHAVRPDSLFPRRKLTPQIWDALCAPDQGPSVQHARVRELFHALQGKGHDGGAIKDVSCWLYDAVRQQTAGTPLQDWLKSLCRHGLAALDAAPSPRVYRRPWRASLKSHAPSKGAGRDDDVLCQSLIQDVCTGLLRSAQPSPQAVSNLDWAFPYELPIKPSALGRTRVPRTEPVARHEFVDPAVLLRAPSGSPFPTPLGRAQAFRAMLEKELRLQAPSGLWDAVRAMWYGLALGWLDLDPIDLADPRAGIFLRVVGFLEQRDSIAILRTTRPIDGHPVGTALGATDPECGLWSGVRLSPQDGDPIQRVLAALARDLHAQPQLSRRAASVLSAWVTEVKELPGLSPAAPLPLWMRVLEPLLRGAEPARRGDLATTAPIPLSVPGLGAVPIYPFYFDRLRQVRRDMLFEQLRSRRLRWAERQEGTGLQACLDNGQRVALLQTEVSRDERLLLDHDATVRRGALRLSLLDGLVVGRKLPPNGSIDELLPGGDLRPLAEWLRGRSTSRARLPDLLWPREAR